MKRILLLFSALILPVCMLQAQEMQSKSHTVYLVGNSGIQNVPEAELGQLKLDIKNQQGEVILIHLGDIISGEDKEGKVSAEDQAKIEQWSGVLPNSNSRFYFVPGDKDWGNSGKNGLKTVRQVEQQLKNQFAQKDIVIPEDGCPGPKVIDIDSNLRIIAINTHWWMHPYDKPIAPNTDCKTLSRQEFIEKLDDDISEAGNRNVLIVGHHPIVSHGVYGGNMTAQKHLFPFRDQNPNNWIPLPVLGSVYAAYRQNIGTPRDMSNQGYQNFIADIEHVLKQHKSVIYASAHEYSLQLNKSEENYHVVSGSLVSGESVGKGKETVFKSSGKGFVRLAFNSDGSVNSHFLEFGSNGLEETKAVTLFQSPCNAQSDKNTPVNTKFNPCLRKPYGGPEYYPVGQANVVAGEQYKADGFKRMFLGSLYRNAWTQPVSVPYLHLDTVHGGLTPVGTGGGRQTKSLSLLTDDGTEYVFRSVDKDPVKALPVELRNTFIEDLARDMTATGHPYGAVVVSSLLDSTEILHARPKVYYLPDHAKLGQYRQEYANMLGMLEVKPGDPTDSLAGFENSDDMKRSFGLYEKMYRDNSNRPDAQKYAKARAFDILIGDWGRHDDNWKWAGYKKNDGDYVYEPIPRDRDHAFSKWNGLLPSLADSRWALPGVENFGREYKDIRGLTWPARHLDRFVLGTLNRDQWRQIATELQAQMDDATIDAAIAEMPENVQAQSGNEIRYKLKSRRDHLPEAIDKYYLLLSNNVDVVGSNKHEYFLVERLPENTVRVRMYKKSKGTDQPEGEALFDRTFVRGETEEIRIYGLDGNDVVDLTGNSDNSIRVRVIGGEGQDVIRDQSGVKSLRKQTIVYDNTNTQLTASGETKVRLSDEEGVNTYNRTAFEYDRVLVSPALFYNRSDGLGGAIEVGRIKEGFRKPEYKHRYSLTIKGSDNGLFMLSFNSDWRKLFGNWDGGFQAEYGNYFRFYDFFGLGNNTTKDDDLFDDDYYRARYRGVNGGVFLIRRFLRQSKFTLAPQYERYNTDYAANSFLGLEGTEVDFIEDRYEEFGSLKAELDIDLRNKSVFTRRGIRIYAMHNSQVRLSDESEENDNFGLTEGFVEYAGTARLGIPVTLVLKAGGARNYGENLPFYKYTHLGLNHYLRGYVRNRFTGDASMFGNSELRLHLGQVRSQFIPFYYGVFGFYDKGKVWFKGDDTGGWHDGYGGGFYIAPLTDRFTLSVELQHSEEESVLLQVEAGFRIDQ